MAVTWFLLLNSTCILLHMPGLTLWGQTYHLSPIKILLSQLCPPSGLIPTQSSTSQRPTGGILSMMRDDFPELSRLFGTGTTGSKSTSEPGESKGEQRTSTVYWCAWSNWVRVSKDIETSGSVHAWSSIALWLNSPQKSFTSWRMESSGLTIPLDARILSSCQTMSM